MESTVPMEWLMLSLKILRLKRYVKVRRQSDTLPSREKLDIMCDDILEKRVELISIDISEDEFDQGKMTKSRARANLSIAMSNYAWSQRARAIPKLVSAMRHMDSFELFKVTRDPRFLFFQRREENQWQANKASSRWLILFVGDQENMFQLVSWCSPTVPTI